MKPLHGLDFLLSSGLLGAWVLAGAGVLAAQSPAPVAAPAAIPPDPAAGVAAGVQDQDQDYVLHITTRRVVVDVVVTGPDGKPVHGLTQQDFTVFEDRKPQPIHGFEAHTPESDQSPLPPAPDQLPSHTFMNLERTPASGPLVVVLLDFLNTTIEDQMVAHDQILRFLGGKPASTEVAIFALGDSLSLLQGFTTDRDRLLADMRSRVGSPRLAGASDQLQRAETTLDAFSQIGAFLAAMSGRKNLLWFSGSFNMLFLPQAQNAETGTMSLGGGAAGQDPEFQTVQSAPSIVAGSPGFGPDANPQMPGTANGSGSLTALSDRLRTVATALAVSQTAVYPIDVRGLAVESGFSAALADPSSMLATPSQPQATPAPHSTINSPGQVPASVQSHLDYMQSLNDSHATMEQIAEATGGRAYVNTNGIAEAASQAVNDGASYYTLVYAPSNLKFDGGLRQIHVALDKQDYKLAYRSAYFAVDPAAVSPAAVGSGSLTPAMLHGAPQSHGLIFKAKIDPDGPPSAAPADAPVAAKVAGHAARKVKKDPNLLSGIVQSYSIRLAIVAHQVQFNTTADGRRHAALEIAVCAYGADGRKLGGTIQHLQASLPPLVYEQSLQDGVYHSLHVQLPVESVSLRLAIRDTRNDRTGSMEVALPLPPAQQAAASAPATAEASGQAKKKVD
jgi:VWFA-related protein